MKNKQIFSTYKNLLSKYISFKSVSTDHTFKDEMNKTVKWLNDLLKQGGFKTTLWHGKKINPIIFAEYSLSPKAKTILIYGHYDVQPADKEDGWTNDPFKLTEKKGKFIARGVVDNKGQSLIHIISINELIKNKSLTYNIKFLLEGNEESGNPEIASILKKNKKLLDCDLVMISDGEIVGPNPTLEASLRGGGNIRVIYETAPSDLHSGLYGGAIPSAAFSLTTMLAGLKDKNNAVVVKGFYDNVSTPTKAQLKNNKNLGTRDMFMKLAGVKDTLTEKGVDPWTQVGLRPTIEISGVNTGYTGVGFKNIVPARAEARINIRTTHPQKTNEVFEKVINHIKKETPKYVKLTIEKEEHGNPIWLNTQTPNAKMITTHLENSHGKKVLIKHVGGSIPIVADFAEILKKEVLLVSLGNDDCNMHGVNENYTMDLIKKGLNFSYNFFSK